MSPTTHRQLVDELASVESLSKLFAVSLGVLYLVGFLSVTCHLSRYGVSSFSILQLQYLIAGVWVLGPPVIGAALMLISRRFDERAAPEVVGRFNWRRVVMSSTLTGLPSLVFIGLLVLIPNVVEHVSWAMAIRLFLFYWVGLNCAQLFWMSLRADVESETWWCNRSHAAPFYMAFLLIIVMAYSVWFSVRIYPLIPFSLGGGRPLTVAFFEGGEKRMPDEIKKLDPSAKRSIPYRLLLATDKYYIVVSPAPEEQSLEVNRESVAGMVVLR